MSDNDFAVQVDFTGKTVVVEFWIQTVIADWWLSELKGTATVAKWTGRTDDNIADAVVIDPKSLDKSINLGWLVVLYGPQQDMDVQVTVDVRQGGNLLGQKQQTVSLKAKTAQQLTGTISLV